MLNDPPILIIGPPRSGTTWIAKALTTSQNTQYIHEPDNEKTNITAYYLKKNLPRFPYLSKNANNENFKKIFELAFNGKIIQSNSKTNEVLKKTLGITYNKIEQRIIANQHITSEKDLTLTEKLFVNIFNLKLFINEKRKIIKSVHSVLSLPFLYSNFSIEPLIVVRHPAAIINSYLKLKLNDANRLFFKQGDFMRDHLLPYRSKIEKIKSEFGLMGLQIGILYYFLSEIIFEYKFIYVKHENLIIDPIEKFKEIFSKLSLDWSQNTIKFIKEHNAEGFSDYSISRSLKYLKDVWKNSLSSDQINEIRDAFEILPNCFGYKFD